YGPTHRPPDKFRRCAGAPEARQLLRAGAAMAPAIARPSAGPASVPGFAWGQPFARATSRSCSTLQRRLGLANLASLQPHTAAESALLPQRTRLGRLLAGTPTPTGLAEYTSL